MNRSNFCVFGLPVFSFLLSVCPPVLAVGYSCALSALQAPGSSCWYLYNKSDTAKSLTIASPGSAIITYQEVTRETRHCLIVPPCRLQVESGISPDEIRLAVSQPDSLVGAVTGKVTSNNGPLWLLRTTNQTKTGVRLWVASDRGQARVDRATEYFDQRTKFDLCLAAAFLAIIALTVCLALSIPRKANFKKAFYRTMGVACGAVILVIFIQSLFLAAKLPPWPYSLMQISITIFVLVVAAACFWLLIVDAHANKPEIDTIIGLTLILLLIFAYAWTANLMAAGVYLLLAAIIFSCLFFIPKINYWLKKRPKRRRVRKTEVRPAEEASLRSSG